MNHYGKTRLRPPMWAPEVPRKPNSVEIAKSCDSDTC